MTESDKTKIIKLGELSSFKDSQESVASKISIITALITLSGVSTVSISTNEEWKVVYTDNEDKVLFGITQDNEWKIYADLDEVIDCIVSNYS